MTETKRELRMYDKMSLVNFTGTIFYSVWHSEKTSFINFRRVEWHCSEFRTLLVVQRRTRSTYTWQTEVDGDEWGLSGVTSIWSKKRNRIWTSCVGGVPETWSTRVPKGTKKESERSQKRVTLEGTNGINFNWWKEVVRGGLETKKVRWMVEELIRN